MFSARERAKGYAFFFLILHAPENVPSSLIQMPMSHLGAACCGLLLIDDNKMVGIPEGNSQRTLQEVTA